MTLKDYDGKEKECLKIRIDFGDMTTAGMMIREIAVIVEGEPMMKLEGPIFATPGDTVTWTFKAGPNTRSIEIPFTISGTGEKP